MAREVADLKNNADKLISSTEKMIKDLGDQLDAAEKTEIEEKVKELKDAVEADNIEKVKESIENTGSELMQPIVVDKKNVIVVGHTRLLAAKRPGNSV